VEITLSKSKIASVTTPCALQSPLQTSGISNECTVDGKKKRKSLIDEVNGLKS
jgi:hypothetical protein